MFFSLVIAPWIDLSIKAGHLAFEAQALMGLRLFRMATGAVPPLAEAQRMIPEKVSALNDARALVAKGGLSDRTAGKVVALYRGRVKAIKNRLSKSPRVSQH
jgi:hypothetical protein